MLDNPQILDVPMQRTAYVRLTIPRSSIQKEMGPAIEELFTSLREQSIMPEGPVFSHHLRMDPATFDIEVGVPVAAQISENGRVRSGYLPASQVVRSIYSGSYEGLHEGWNQLDGWIRARGLTMAPNLWEVYVRGPESGGDPSTWQTELNRPIVA